MTQRPIFAVLSSLEQQFYRSLAENQQIAPSLRAALALYARAGAKQAKTGFNRLAWTKIHIN